jgi:hypothetical protein
LGESGKREEDCWVNFLESIIARCRSIEGFNGESIPRIRRQHTLAGLRDLLPANLKQNLVIYFKYESRFSKKNHISLTPDTEARCLRLDEMMKDDDLSSARYLAYSVVTVFTIDASLYADIAKKTPKAGRAPMDSDALTKQRVDKFNAHRGNFSFGTYTGDMQTYSKSVTMKAVDETNADVKAWIENTSGLNLWIAVAMHMAVRPSWNADRHYFLALGAPKINGESLFFSFPGDFTHACVCDGIHDWYNAMVNSARANNRVDGLAVMTKMFDSWGIPVLTTFVMVNKNTGNDMSSYCYADFLNPFFNGHSKNIDNKTMRLIADDIDYFIMMMGKFARGSAPGVARVGLPKDQIDFQKTNFFKATTPPKIKGNKI